MKKPLFCIKIFKFSLVYPKSKISSELFIATLDIITIDEIEYLTELKRHSSDIVVDRIDNKEVLWSKYKSHLEKTGDATIPEDCIFEFDIKLIWKLLSDKNLILFESKEDFLYLQYKYSTSNSSMSSEVLSIMRSKYKISDFGQEFINWVLS